MIASDTFFFFFFFFLFFNFIFLIKTKQKLNKNWTKRLDLCHPSTRKIDRQFLGYCLDPDPVNGGWEFCGLIWTLETRKANPKKEEEEKWKSVGSWRRWHYFVFTGFRSGASLWSNNNSGSGKMGSSRYCKWRTCILPTARRRHVWTCFPVRPPLAPTSTPPPFSAAWSSPRNPISLFSPVTLFFLYAASF